LALTQLAEGKGRANLADACVPPDCPHEFAATQTGAIYDGNELGDLILGRAARARTSIPTDGVGGAGDMTKLLECANKAKQCQKDKSAPFKRLGELQTQLNGLYGQMGGACDNECDCDPCNSLKGQIQGLCAGELRTVIAQVKEPCDLPAYCADLGITDPSTSAAGAAEDMCKMDMQDCGCDDWFCDVSCLFDDC